MPNVIYSQPAFASALLFLSVCVVSGASGTQSEMPQDTARPMVPDSLLELPDTSLLVAWPTDPAQLYYRTVIGVVFDDSTSGITVKQVFATYQAVIVGGNPGFGSRKPMYILRIPDPGMTYAALDSVLTAIEAEPGVHSTVTIPFSPAWIPSSRYANDGVFARRANCSQRLFALGSACRVGADGAGM